MQFCLGLLGPTSHKTITCTMQKQPPEVFCKKRCSQKFHNIHSKAPVLEFLFNKVIGLQGCNFIKKKFHHICFRAKFATFLRTSILKNIRKRLLLTILAHSPQSSQCWEDNLQSCVNHAGTTLHGNVV